MQKILKNTLLVATAEITSKGITAISTILLVRILAPEGFGIYAFTLTLIAYFIGFIHSGVYSIGVREISKYRELTIKYFNNALVVKFFNFFLSFITLLIIIFLIQKPLDSKITFLLVGIYLFLMVFHIDWIFRGTDKMEVPALGGIIQGLTFLLMIIFFVKTPNDVRVAVIVYILSWALSIILQNAIFFKTFKPKIFQFEKNSSFELFRNSLPIALSSLIIAIYGNLNVFILNLFKGDYETGIYSAMTRIIVLLFLPNNILQISFFPEISRGVLDGSFKIRQRQYILSAFLVVYILIFAIFGYSKEFILLLFGEKYLEGEIILKIALASTIFAYLSSTLILASIALEKQKVFLWTTIIGVITSLIANLIFVPIYSGIGAAISLFLTELTVFLGAAFFSRGHSLLSQYKVVIAPFILGVASLLVSKAVSVYLGFYFGLLTFVFIFVSSIFLLKILSFNQLIELIKSQKNS
ncbi:MAG: flippase [Ignavibacteria bacterium]|nr:flippase [Ignavibacteria bacterium]